MTCSMSVSVFPYRQTVCSTQLVVGSIAISASVPSRLPHLRGRPRSPVRSGAGW